jgi:hypothetical protein
MDINEIVEALNAGASADIWYDPQDANDVQDAAAIQRIELTQTAMTEAANLLSDFITLGHDQETTEPTIPEGSFHVQVGRDATAYFGAIIPSDSLEEAKGKISKYGYECHFSTAWTAEGSDELDNAEVCNITSPDGTIVRWTNGDGWEET